MTSNPPIIHMVVSQSKAGPELAASIEKIKANGHNVELTIVPDEAVIVMDLANNNKLNYVAYKCSAKITQWLGGFQQWYNNYFVA